MDHKVGVIPFDISGERIAVMFVTSQMRGRWILPKGSLNPKESHIKGCKREAFQEAGVTGALLTDFPMTHIVTTTANKAIPEVVVTYYPLLVLKQFDEWPEKLKRDRHWALLDDAARVTDREDFRQIIIQFRAIRPWILETAKRKKV